MFVVYGAGMSVVLMGVTAVLAPGRRSLASRLGGSVRFADRGPILVGAGVSTVWFGITEVRSRGAAPGSSTVFRLVETPSQAALDFVADHSFAALAGFVIVLAVAGGPGRGRDESGERTRLAAR